MAVPSNPADQLNKPADARANRPAPNDSIKETFESIIIAFILAFVFRAYVVEAFVIPTGSMAPTLLGEHVPVRCAECGYEFKLDSDRQRFVPRGSEGQCPMCHYPNSIRPGTPVSAGDRILVHKYVYSIAEPRRWDVVVFKAPHEPETNYIKRLVGLPSESLLLIEGNVYVKPDAPANAAWRIARKTDTSANPQALRVQRAVWQPVYHSQFVPLDGGDGPNRRGQVWRLPWQAVQGDWLTTPDGELRLATGYQTTSPAPAQIDFSFGRALVGGPGPYPYNQSKPLNIDPIEDVRIAADVVPAGPGLSVEFSTTARLAEPDGLPWRITGSIDASGVARLTATNPRTEATLELTKPTTLAPLPVARATPVELWHVDQEVSLWVDGRRVLVHAVEVDMDTLLARSTPRERFPHVSIRTAGAAVALNRVEVDRDLYYRAVDNAMRQGRATFVKGAEQDTVSAHVDAHHGQTARVIQGPLHIRADEFFCMGDNSPWSLDSRFWDTVDPWVRYRLMGDEPRLGIVPREIMMGRAFFVYFPAPLRWKPANPYFAAPNFGNMRFIH